MSRTLGPDLFLTLLKFTVKHMSHWSKVIFHNQLIFKRFYKIISVYWKEVENNFPLGCCVCSVAAGRKSLLPITPKNTFCIQIYFFQTMAGEWTFSTVLPVNVNGNFCPKPPLKLRGYTSFWGFVITLLHLTFTWRNASFVPSPLLSSCLH